MITAEQTRVTFRALTGLEEPFPYQCRVSEAIEHGSNVLLRAPTGAGKTIAALLPYLATRQVGTPCADQVLYTLPLRTLATSLHQSTLGMALRAGLNPVSLPLAAGESSRRDRIHITLQTGEQQNDPYLLGDIIFTTIDQLLSAYINRPVSLSRRQANYNGGALIGALVILDEVHLLETGRSLATAVDMARRLKGLTQCLWMTATASREAASRLCKALDAVLIDVAPEERAAMPAQRDKERRWIWVGQELTAEHVLQHHAGGRSIALCNTVARAQQLFQDLLDGKADSTQVYLLHSRFFPEDRKVTESRLDSLFGPAAPKQDVILIATQVVEAGIDISAETLHSEICPANALLQRAGRCARYPGLRGKGTVYVYDAPNHLPYKMDLVHATRCALVGMQGEILHYDQEQALVDQIHGDLDALAFGQVLGYARTQHALSVDEAMNEGSGQKVRELIRDVDSLSIVIHDNPSRAIPDLRHLPAAIGIPRTSLFRLKDLFESTARKGEDIAWIPEDSPGEEEQQGGPLVVWRPVNSFDALRAAPYLAVIHPSMASYTPELGLRLGIPGNTIVRWPAPKVIRRGGGMQCETWLQHAAGTLQEGRRLREHRMIAASRLDARTGLPSGTTLWLSDLACLLHDAGKLNSEWQTKISAWQHAKNRNAAAFQTGEPLAHSDLSWPEDAKSSRQPPYGPLPPHAFEGAYATFGLVHAEVAARIGDEALIDICLQAMASAIGRHHGAFAKTLGQFGLHARGSHAVEQATHLLDPTSQRTIRLQERPDARDREAFVQEYIAPANDDLPYHLYRFIVRYLRLADTRALESRTEEDASQ